MNRPLRLLYRNEMLEHHDQILSLRTRFWRWLCLYGFRHWTTTNRGRPVGIPGERDPQFPCTAYTPRPRQVGEDAHCDHPDGHYLCSGCAENRLLITINTRPSTITIPRKAEEPVCS